MGEIHAQPLAFRPLKPRARDFSRPGLEGRSITRNRPVGTHPRSACDVSATCSGDRGRTSSHTCASTDLPPDFVYASRPCHPSSAVEQRFRKAQVVGSNPMGGFAAKPQSQSGARRDPYRDERHRRGLLSPLSFPSPSESHHGPGNTIRDRRRLIQRSTRRSRKARAAQEETPTAMNVIAAVHFPLSPFPPHPNHTALRTPPFATHIDRPQRTTRRSRKARAAQEETPTAMNVIAAVHLHLSSLPWIRITRRTAHRDGCRASSSAKFAMPKTQAAAFAAACCHHIDRSHLPVISFTASADPPSSEP